MAHEESATFDARYGHVALVTRAGAVTFESVSKLAEAAQLIGVPRHAEVTGIRLQRASGDSTEISIDWRMP